MALEGIAALGLATNIIQLIDFSFKISELSKAFRENCGELPNDLRRVEDLVHDLVPIAERLQRASATSSNPLLQEQTLAPLLSGCVREANDFKLLLDSFKATSQSGWTSFLQALKATRRAGKIKNIEKALESYKTAMTLRIVDASLVKLEYTAELLNQNQAARSLDTQTTPDALQRLDRSINASFHHMEDEMHRLSRASESTAEATDQAKREIEKLNSDHAAWAQENYALQQRLRSTDIAVRPMILQFQTLHKRKAKLSPRRASTAIAKHGRRFISPHEMLSQEERPSDKKKKAFNISIVISVSIDAAPAELMYSLKKLLYTSWIEVTRRIAANVPQVYHMNENEDKVSGSDLDVRREPSSGDAVLLAFLKIHGEDQLLTYDPASSTLTAESDHKGLNINVACACDFYWKGFSQKLLKIDTQVPGNLSTLQYQLATTTTEEISPQPLLEAEVQLKSDKASKTILARQVAPLKPSEAEIARQGRRRRRRRSNKARLYLVRAICAPFGLLVLLSLFATAYSLLLQDFALSGYSTTAFWRLRDFLLGPPETKDSTYDGSRKGLREFDEQWAQIKRKKTEPRKRRKAKVMVL